MNTWIMAQLAGVAINLVTAHAMLKRGDIGFCVAFLAYAVACEGYAYSIWSKGSP